MFVYTSLLALLWNFEFKLVGFILNISARSIAPKKTKSIKTAKVKKVRL